MTGHAGIGVEAGTVEAFGEQRSYQGLAIMGGLRFRSLELMAHVPFYRMELGARSGEGLGDIHLEVGWVALDQPVEAGLSAAIMPPFGDDRDGLGMGHWMLMAGGFARVHRGRLQAAANLGYGGALGSQGHAEHGIPVWPPVAPMNAHEIRAGLQGRVAVWRAIAAVASAAAAAPIGDGEFLALVGGGAAAQLGRVEVGLELRHGLFAHTAGLVVTSHATFAF